MCHGCLQEKVPKSIESEREGFLEEVTFELTLEEGSGVYCGRAKWRKRWDIIGHRMEKKDSPGIWASMSEGQRHKQHAIFGNLQGLIRYDCVL